MAVLCSDLYPTLFPHSPIDRQQGKWEQAFDAKIYGIVLVDSASNDQLSFWLPVNTTQTSAGFRPWVKGGEGRGSSRPWDKGEDRSPKYFFSTLRASVSSKNKGGRGRAPQAPPLDPPLQNIPEIVALKLAPIYRCIKSPRKDFDLSWKTLTLVTNERVLELARIPVFWTIIQQETQCRTLLVKQLIFHTIQITWNIRFFLSIVEPKNQLDESCSFTMQTMN